MAMQGFLPTCLNLYLARQSLGVWSPESGQSWPLGGVLQKMGLLELLCLFLRTLLLGIGTGVSKTHFTWASHECQPEGQFLVISSDHEKKKYIWPPN